MSKGKKRVIRIGFLGLGTVGQGVWKHIQRNSRRLENRLGVRLELHRAAVRDTGKKRPFSIPEKKLTKDGMAVATDPEVDIVCELMGGKGRARELTLAALEHGKVVVSANKALLCEHGSEIFAAARAGKGHYFFEASVAGGIPIIKALREGLVANRFQRIYGILNGTCNYILTRMEEEGADFSAVVKAARKLGYVEADESLDIDGWDTAHKAVILAFLAHGRWLRYDEMHIEGIRRVTLEDIREAARLGYAVKLLAVIESAPRSQKLHVSVHPALVPRQNVLANLGGPYNGVSVTGDVAGTTVYIGRGAGQDATASAVISDIADAALSLQNTATPVLPEEAENVHAADSKPIVILPAEEVRSRYYARLTVKDAPGVLARIAAAMAENGVSIASVLQKPAGKKGKASLILTTHESNEQDMRRTIGDLGKLPVVLEAPFVLRIAEFEE